MLQEKQVQIKRGERVLIVGESGTGKTLLFRALAGLWPWGSGTVTHPADEEILYMPRTPYLPPGTLREVLAYPKPTSDIRHRRLLRCAGARGSGTPGARSSMRRALGS